MDEHGITIIYAGKINKYYGPAASKQYIEFAPNASWYIETDGEHNIYIYDETTHQWSEF